MKRKGTFVHHGGHACPFDEPHDIWLQRGGGGGGGTPAIPSGKVIQGPVSGASVFADHASGPEANDVLDADEQLLR